MSLRVYYGPALARYGFGHGHPFGPDRLDAFWREAVARGLTARMAVAAPVVATEAELAAFHTTQYIARVRTLSDLGQGYLDAGDTPAFAGVYEAACSVVGSSLDAARRAASGEAPRAFVPIGGLHHATRHGAAGFCVFNDIGVVIEQLRRETPLRRFAYVDIDAHHGDGVYYGFAADPEVFIADIHEDGRYLYPGTGAVEERGDGAARGTKLNLPLPPEADDDAFAAVWPQVEAFVRAARPEMILLQAGADSIAGDPITHLRLSSQSHRRAAASLRALADEYCHGRFIAFGGGGYNRANLARAWCDVVEAMGAADTAHPAL